MLLLHTGLGSLAVEKTTEREYVVGTNLWNSHGDALYHVWSFYLPFSPFCYFAFSSFWCHFAGESLWAGRTASSFLYHSYHEWPGVRWIICSHFHDLCNRQCVFLLFDLARRFLILWLFMLVRIILFLQLFETYFFQHVLLILHVMTLLLFLFLFSQVAHRWRTVLLATSSLPVL